MADPIAEFKTKQRETWALGDFGAMAVFSIQVAGHFVRFAGVRAGQRVLDIATGTGVVAITAARLGATVSGLDLTPELLEQARKSAPIAGLQNIDWKEISGTHPRILVQNSGVRPRNSRRFVCVKSPW
jgi:2-polyprenyl-3-methyl-5-hydroxy-6-metoxy-1,4-benzoquinol methylase